MCVSRSNYNSISVFLNNWLSYWRSINKDHYKIWLEFLIKIESFLWHLIFCCFKSIWFIDLCASEQNLLKIKSLIKKRHKSSINLYFPLSVCLCLSQFISSHLQIGLMICLFVRVGFAWIVCQKQADYFCIHFASLFQLVDFF